MSRENDHRNPQGAVDEGQDPGRGTGRDAAAGGFAGAGKSYVDTGYLFRIYSGEPGHHEVKALLSGCDRVASARRAKAEFAAIVLRKKREAPAHAEAFDELHQQFLDEHRDGHIELLRLDEGVMEGLESVLKSAPADPFLSAADALHLACAAEHRFTEALSNDRHFRAAAPLFGLTGRNVIV